MNYPPPNLWTQVQLNPKPDAEPELVKVAPDLALPVEWPVERRAAFLERWQHRQSR